MSASKDKFAVEFALQRLSESRGFKFPELLLLCRTYCDEYGEPPDYGIVQRLFAKEGWGVCKNGCLCRHPLSGPILPEVEIYKSNGLCKACRSPNFKVWIRRWAENMLDDRKAPEGYKRCSSRSRCVNPMDGAPILPVSEFYKSAHSIDGYDYMCQFCVSKKQRSRRNSDTDVEDRHGYIYFLLSPTLNRVKIGFASDVKSRILAYSTHSPEPLTLLGFIPGTMQDERELQNRFSAHRTHLEWFDFAPEFRDFLETLGLQTY